MSKCECMTWARVPGQFNEQERYPPSEHHRDCPAFEVARFIRIEADGTYLICEPHEVQDLTEDLSAFTGSEVFLTWDQFEKLPEFAGW